MLLSVPAAVFLALLDLGLGSGGFGGVATATLASAFFLFLAGALVLGADFEGVVAEDP